MRRERELDSTVRRPADAEKFRLEKIAEANRNRLIMEAEAEAEAKILKGEADAFAIEAKAKAEAEKMAKKADAWKEYKEAALLDMMLEALPKVSATRGDLIYPGARTLLPITEEFSLFSLQIAAEVAAPLSQARKISMVCDGSSEIGAAKLTNEVLTIMTAVPTLVKNLTGVDITNQISRAGLQYNRVSYISYLAPLGFIRSKHEKVQADDDDASKINPAHFLSAHACMLCFFLFQSLSGTSMKGVVN